MTLPVRRSRRSMPVIRALFACWMLVPALAGCSEGVTHAVDAAVEAEPSAAPAIAATVALQAPVVRGAQTITLTPNHTGLGDRELVTLGIPFQPGIVSDPRRVRILDAAGNEMPAFVKQTLAWHWLDGSVRAVKVQFHADPKRAYRFAIDQPRTQSMEEVPYEQGTRPGKMDAPVPRVLATLDPTWLVESRIAGMQLPHDGKRAYDRYVDRQWQWAKDTPYAGSHGFLFDRASVIGMQYVRSGRPDAFAEFYNSATFYLSKIKRGGNGGGWPDCTGGWEFDGVNACDPKYSYVTPHLLLVALAGDDTRLDAATIKYMADNQVKGGWSGPLGPYTGGNQSWTERHTGLALEHLVSNFELTGSPATRKHIDDVIGWLHAHQQTPPAPDPATGAWTHSWQAHEGGSYDAATDVRGGSPWMGANLVGGLWRAWQVTQDERIPVMLRDFGRYIEQYGFAPDSFDGKWQSACNTGGTIGWYFSSGIAPLEKVVAIQESEGWGSDSHNPELLMVIAAARRFETDPEWRSRFDKRAERLSKYLNDRCAAVSHTARAFNWQNRNPEFLWLLEQ